MTGELTTQPMLEALLEGQRQLASQLAEMRDAIATMSDKQGAIDAKQDTISANQDAIDAKQDTISAMQDVIAAKQETISAMQDALAGKQDELAARQDRLDVRLTELTSKVEDGFDDTTRKIEIFNDRLLGFESWLKRVDRRLHDEILARTR
ncbi:MAG: hypothetical protein AABO57_05580 [Acidobacteriota bacterium]